MHRRTTGHYILLGGEIAAGLFVLAIAAILIFIAPEAGVDAETVENKIIKLFHSHHRPWFATSRYIKKFTLIITSFWSQI